MENPLNSPKSYFSGQNLTKTRQEKKHWRQMNTLQTLHVSRCVVVHQTKANCRQSGQYYYLLPSKNWDWKWREH
jgi:hypothetical protein